MSTIAVKRLPDGSLVEVLPDGTTRPVPAGHDWSVADALTDDEIASAAEADPDARPLPEGWIERASKCPHPALVRKRLRLTQQEFAARYRIPLDVLVAWEDKRLEPDDVARAYMKAILGDPEAVARALRPRAAE